MKKRMKMKIMKMKRMIDLDEKEDNDHSKIESNDDYFILSNYSAYPGGRVNVTNKHKLIFLLTHN